MSMIEDWNDSHLAPLLPGQGSYGATSGFSENFNASSERQFRVDSMFGLQAEMDDRFFKNLEKVKQITGQEVNVDQAALIPWIRSRVGQQPFSTMDPWRPGQDKQSLLDAMNNFNGQLQKIKADGYPIQTLDDMLGDVVKMRQQVMGNAESVGARQGVSGWAGSMLGSMWGSLSFKRDPLLVGSFALPGFGKAFATRVISEFAVNAGAEAVQQYAGIRPTKKLLGEEQTNPFGDILMAGVLGATVHTGLELAPRGFRVAERAIAPDRANARIFRDSMEAALREDFPMRSATHEDLFRALDKLEPTPIVRASKELLLRDMQTLEAAGYKPPLATRVEAVRTAQEIADYIDIAEGRKTATSVNRFLGNVADEQGRMSDPILATAREMRPDLYRQMDEAHARLTEAEAAIQDFKTQRAGRTVADAFDIVAPDIAPRVRAIEEELNGAIPRTRRTELEKELDRMVEAVGQDNLVKAEADASIGPRKNERRLQQQRNLRKKEYTKLKKEANGVEAKVLNDIRARGNIERMLARNSSFESEVARLDSAAAARPQLTNGIKDRALGQARPESGKTSPEPAPKIAPEKIDLGEDTLVDPKFQYFDDANGTTLSIKQGFEDMAEDDRMLQAMRSCAI